jgi:hypothetical protein
MNTRLFGAVGNPEAGVTGGITIGNARSTA